LLPGGNVLTVDVNNQNVPYAEVFNPTANPPSWSEAGNLTIQLWGNFPGNADIGPALTLTDGTVLATGTMISRPPACGQPPAPACVSGNTAIYSARAGWSAGPPFQNITVSNSTGMGDQSATLLPDGNVLLPTPDALGGHHFKEYLYQSKSLCPIENMSLGLASGAKPVMVLLPSGQVLITTQRSDYYIYTPSSSFGPQQSWRPTVTPSFSTITPGQSQTVFGTKFNGMSQGTTFGDENQSATNYPLVQITDSNQNVFYAPTSGHSTMGIATGGTPTHTTFTVPCGVVDGPATLIVIANGISSTPPTNVTVTGQCPAPAN
jgi:hypothetical protein